ncbi:piggyBac transposable element-derived protein 4-like [Macrobrachium rosenbergii]|uniref:piggyBac transposable element-derived protein 4-like n=1 Tax=Macrobrachium rosenbergii TaxID=79674 RepID=UPI0034D3C26E
MANKPDKFGVKFWLAVDSSSKYLVNGFPYLGKDAHRPSNQSLSEFVVLQLMDPFLGKGRNVTTDNFFTSVKLAEQLEKKKTSIIGTMNRIRREIPPEIKTCKAPLHSTKILKNNNMTLTVYQGKTNKNVLLLSTVHKNVSVSEEGKKIPDSVKYYNETKYGVDIIDQMARLYSTKVSSRRWPLQMFYNVLDLAGINAHIVYKEVTGKKVSRSEFILHLVEELQMKDTAEERPNVATTGFLKITLQSILADYESIVESLARAESILTHGPYVNMLSP